MKPPRRPSPRLLFILKRRSGYGYGGGVSSGLFNSAHFIVDMLTRNKVNARLIEVIDNNDIDREVTRYRPTHVVIEALWVVPSKMVILRRLHPTVKWIIRIHSELPFLATEGIAIEWIKEYSAQPNVTVAVNSLRAQHDLGIVLRDDGVFPFEVAYLPNWYPATPIPHHGRVPRPGVLHIGGFGAIRPLKNHLIQAVAALDYARSRNVLLHFHVNSDRLEQGGNTVLSNLRALFSNSRHSLVEHRWKSHADFLSLIREMDVSLAVSYSETFNIVSADATVSGVPIVVSAEIPWASQLSIADPNLLPSIVERIGRSLGAFRHQLVSRNLSRLRSYAEKSEKVWLRYVRT